MRRVLTVAIAIIAAIVVTPTVEAGYRYRVHVRVHSRQFGCCPSQPTTSAPALPNVTIKSCLDCQGP